MIYTQFGNTGVKVSRLGYGCMRLPQALKDGRPQVDEDAAIETLRKAVDLGVNYFDNGYGYHGGMSERILGRAMAGLRDKVSISTKSPGHMVKGPGDYRRILEEQLSRLNMDYIDFYHFHGINYEEFMETDRRAGWHGEALKAKQEGLVKHISFSFHSRNYHDPAPDDMMKLIDTGFFETVLCQYNVLDRSNAPAMEYARQRGLGVAVMGPLGGGRVSGLPREIAGRLGIKAAASAELGLRYVSSNPNVDILLSGMSSMRQLLENAEYVSRIEPLSTAELDGIQAMMEENRRLSELYCTGCEYCMPCPQEVNIPYIFQMMNYHKVYGISDFARKGYAGIGTAWIQGKKADACTQCGACEAKCPQKLNIREQLKESRKALEL
jgi:predicted aldo/keto reductase-like oxidoreductase